MIKVAFTIIGGKSSWMGGVNYLKNLLFAIKQNNNTKLQPVLFVGHKIDKAIIDEFDDLALIVYNSLFDKGSFKWYLDVILRDVFKSNLLVNKLIERHNIKVFSHSSIYGRDLKCKSINWIPDFQHIRLPEMFSFLNLVVRDFRLKNLARFSDKVVLSSNDALNDYKSFAPKEIQKATVINFVSQTKVFNIEPLNTIEQKYNFSGDFFFLPNQFWAHKNHIAVFEAIRQVKRSHPKVKVICSGKTVDDRNMSCVDHLMEFIRNNDLSDNVRIFGLMPYKDVLQFMYYAQAIINPSRFEGWSSTVEESKSMGKEMILSDIPVHIEQAENKAYFFNSGKYTELAEIMSLFLTKQNRKTQFVDDLENRTKVFSSKFEAIVDEVLKKT